MMIIGLAGRKQSGKSTLAQFLCEGLGFKEDSFGAPIRQFVAQLCGYTLGELEVYKEVVHPMFGKTPRHMMQTLGTDWARNTISDSIWVDCLASRLSDANKVVISDLRFENEATAIRAMGGTIIHIERLQNEPTDMHASEAGIKPVLGPDYIIHNNGSINGFFDQAKEILGELK